MQLISDSFAAGKSLPEEFLFGKSSAEGIQYGANMNPHLHWSEATWGAQSYALICCSLDMPENLSEADYAEKLIPYNAPRREFYYWVLVHIPVEIDEIPAGAESMGVTMHGKPLGSSDYGLRGLNDYTERLASNPSLAGSYCGYDGPSLPCGDERIHRIIFTIYALGVRRLQLPPLFTGREALQTLNQHKLGHASLCCTCTSNSRARI